MPSISYDGFAAWSNYHLTLGTTATNNPVPAMTVESLARYHSSDTSTFDALERFAATARPLMDHLAKLQAMMSPAKAQQGRIFAAGLTGRGWSFTPIIGAPVSQLLCDGLAGIGSLNVKDCDAACLVPAERVALASGGTRLREIVNWSEKLGLTIKTSGTHLGATIAGAAGTASHGSRLGFGGIQDMILGMHMIVSNDEHIWIERKSSPVLSHAGATRLTIPNSTLRVIRDDDIFEDALVHLGTMGIVNGVAIELVPNTLFALMRRREKIDHGWIEEISDGEFKKSAARLKCQELPIFYELTLNPHAPFTDDSTHMMYFPRTTASALPPGAADIIRPADAISLLGAELLTGIGTWQAPDHKAIDAREPDPPTAVTRVLRQLLKHDTAYDYYRAVGQFEPNINPFDPNDPSRPGHYWSGLHPDEITGNIPGALYNASFAIPLERLSTAVPAICRAVAKHEPSFVFTLRFVTKPAGTLAFTRFDQNAVIEIDGLSPLICKLAAARIDPGLPDAAELLAALGALAGTLEKGALAVRAALELETIPYSMHWAKLGQLDKAKVLADFGHPSDPESLIRRWRDTRDFLLPPLGRSLFWNDHVINLGLLEPVVA